MAIFLANGPIKNAPPAPISFSQVIQFPPNSVLEKDLQRVASDITPVVLAVACLVT